MQIILIRFYFFLFSTILIFTPQIANQIDLKAFPKAYGAGGFASGGRGKPVYTVSNLQDSGEGSFRWAINQSKETDGGNIVFNVSGVIKLEYPLKINTNNLTIAGQTAPKGGITFTGSSLKVINSDNIIIRYLRIRPEYKKDDAFELINTKNTIVDHVSVNWGGDETISLRGESNNITFQRLLIAEGKTGSLFGDSDHPELSQNLSFIWSLFFNVSHRTPNVNSNGRVDVINNIIQNWQFRLTRVSGSVTLNHINNYYSMGKKLSLDNNVNAAEGEDLPKIFSSGNYIDKSVLTNPKDDNWFFWKQFEGGGLKTPLSLDLKEKNAFPLIGVPFNVLSAEDAYVDVINNVGCNRYIGDDLCIHEQLDNIDEEYLKIMVIKKEGAFLNYKVNSKMQTFTSEQRYIKFHNSSNSKILATRPQNWDSDNDGIPDLWELTNGSNPKVIDNHLDANNNGYSNFEDYINSVD